MFFVFAPAAYCGGAYDFMLKDMSGNTVKLSDYKGKVVFLDFWASWCPPCRDSIPAVKDLHKKHSLDSKAAVLGVNAGEKHGTVDKFLKKQGIDYTVLLGDNETLQKYNVNGIPAFFIIGKDGNIAKKYTGYYRGLEKEWDKEIELLLK